MSDPPPQDERGAAASVRVLVIGPDPRRVAAAVSRIQSVGFSCQGAQASPTALRGALMGSPDVVVALEVAGGWQPTRETLKAQAGAALAAADSPAGPPVLVISEEIPAAQRAEAFAASGSSVWDWVDSSCPDREIGARLFRLARLRRMAVEIEDLSRRCASLETVDLLTGLPSHRAFQEFFSREFRRAERYRSTLSLIMIDLDRFRSLNEDLGHLWGDRLLQETARELRSILREVDMAARFGQEEFTLLLPETDATGAARVATRAHEAIGALPVSASERLRPGPGGEPPRVSASLGTATYPDEGIATRGQLLSACETALRHAKASGRNRVTAYLASMQRSDRAGGGSGAAAPTGAEWTT